MYQEVCYLQIAHGLSCLVLPVELEELNSNLVVVPVRERKVRVLHLIKNIFYRFCFLFSVNLQLLQGRIAAEAHGLWILIGSVYSNLPYLQNELYVYF